MTGLDGLPGVHAVVVDERSVRFEVDADHLDAAIRHLTASTLTSLVSHPPTLEELFRRHYAARGTSTPEPAPR